MQEMTTATAVPPGCS